MRSANARSNTWFEKRLILFTEDIVKLSHGKAAGLVLTQCFFWWYKTCFVSFIYQFSTFDCIFKEIIFAAYFLSSFFLCS